MNDTWTYYILLDGPVDEEELNATSPFQLTAHALDLSTTCLQVHTDQSGLIGLLRHLHGQGLVLFSLRREPALSPPASPAFALQPGKTRQG